MHEPHITIPGNYCTLHGYHYPKPLRTVKHHIFPQEFGGPTVASNLVQVCDTGHYNIHTLLDAMLKERPYAGGTRKERALALAGFQAILDAKKNGTINREALDAHMRGLL